MDSPQASVFETLLGTVPREPRTTAARLSPARLRQLAQPRKKYSETSWQPRSVEYL